MYVISLADQQDKLGLTAAFFTPSGGGSDLYLFRGFRERLHELTWNGGAFLYAAGLAICKVSKSFIKAVFYDKFWSNY
jgi:hypothetical protein